MRSSFWTRFAFAVLANAALLVMLAPSAVADTTCTRGPLSLPQCETDDQDLAARCRAQCAADPADADAFFKALICFESCMQGAAGTPPPDRDRARDPSPPRDDDPRAERCSDFDTSRLSHVARQLFDQACARNFAYTLHSPYPYKDLGFYLKDEDGVTLLIRTGYEVALYRRLKHRLMNREVFQRLPMEALFGETVDAILETKRGSHPDMQLEVNIVEVLLTAHNVTRLLARPEQWMADYPMTDAGQHRPRQDYADPILQDLMGWRSVDFYPTVPQYLGWRRASPQGITKAFFGRPGVYQYFAVANRADESFPAHWNGGIHYYYWIGATGRWLGDSVTSGLYGLWGSEAAAVYEYLQKGLAQYQRASVQIGIGYDQGVIMAEDLFLALHEIKSVYPMIAR